jgi:hypothetical protein
MDCPARVDFVSVPVPGPDPGWLDLTDAEEDHKEHPSGFVHAPRGVQLRDHIDHAYLQAVTKKAENTRLAYYWGIHGERGDVRPRWMRTRGLNSEAMLLAFKGFTQVHSTDPVQRWLPLRMVVHRGHDGGDERIVRERSQGTLAPVLCSMPKCAKCVGLQGGCTFRWCANEWMYAYAFYARLLGDEEETTEASMQQTWGEEEPTGEVDQPLFTSEQTPQCTRDIQWRPGQVVQRRQPFHARQRKAPAFRRRRGCNARPHNILKGGLGGAQAQQHPTPPLSDTSELPSSEATGEQEVSTHASAEGAVHMRNGRTG